MSNWDTAPGTQIAQDSNPPWATTPPWPPQPVPGSPGGPQVNDPEAWSYAFQPPGGAVAAYPGVVMVGTPPQQVATLADIAEATTGVSSFNTRTGAVTLTLSDVTGAGGAPSNSPTFVGSANYATQPLGTNSTLLATCQFVQQALANQPGVYSWNGRTGAVTLSLSDVTGAGGAPAASPNLTGVPTTPTAPLNTNTGQIASCSYVMNAIGNSVVSWNGRVGAVTMTLSDITTAGGAPLNAPTFTGVASASTAPPGTATTQLATTAFVTNAVSAATAGVSSFNTRTGAVTLQAADISGVGGALLAGPAFTGSPTAPTPSAGSDNNSIATTAFVTTALAGASVVSSWNGRTGAVTLTEGDISGASGITVAGGTITGGLTVQGTTSLGTTTLGATTITSTLTLNANASANLQAVPYQQLVSYVSGQLGNYLPLTGGTLNPGPLIIAGPSGSGSLLNLIAPAGTARTIFGNTGTASSSTARWAISLGDGTAESGSNAGSAFLITNYTDAGAVVNAGVAPLAINRATGNSQFTCNNLGISSLAGAAVNVNLSAGTYSAINFSQGGVSSQIYTDATYYGVGESGTFPLTSSWRYTFIRSSGQRIWQDWQGVNLMSLVAGGNLSIAGTLSQGSDAKTKRDIIDSRYGLRELLTFVTKQYTRIVESDREVVPETREEIGLIAQDVQAVMPEAVTETTHGHGGTTLGLDYNAVVAVLVNAVRELHDRLATLEAALT